MVRTFRYAAICILGAQTICFWANCQELYPLSEPASTMPKNVIGIRQVGEFYKQAGVLKAMSATRILYGISSKWTMYGSLVASNHHGPDLPSDFPSNHTHNYPLTYKFKPVGVHLYTKYRFYSHDRMRQHLRLAVYAEGSKLNSPHDEAEPNLFDDNSGMGAGLIATYLHHKFAVSLTGGIVKPFSYSGKVPDPLPGMPFVPARINYPAAALFDLSFGYLLFPRKYKNYKQTNWNIYLELKGKTFGAPEVFIASPVMAIVDDMTYYLAYTKNVPLLKSGTYLDANYGLQWIFNSNLRVDLTLRTPLIGRSLSRTYPGIYIAVQRYFFR
jgi:hypothetical protein